MGPMSHSPVGHVERSVLLAIKERLQTASHVVRTVIAPRHGKPTLTVGFDRRYFPAAVEEAYYDIRWYTTGDFEIHYQENWENRSWQCR